MEDSRNNPDVLGGRPVMAVQMTPLQYAKKFFELDVFFYDQELSPGPEPAYVPPYGWQNVSANNYRLGSSSWREIFWTQDIKKNFTKPVTVKVANMWGHDEELTLNAEQARFHYSFPFVGKGSPEQVQIAMQLVYRFRRVATTIEQFADRDFVGLDCNGFVGGYFQKVVQGQDWKTANPNKDPGPTSYMSQLHTLGTEVADFKDLDPAGTYIFTWCRGDGTIIDPVGGGYGHVMITEPNTLKGAPGTQTIKVVEATPPKLREIDYTIRSSKALSKKSAMFLVERGKPTDQMWVRVCKMKLPW
jgi:hypothetical protein